MPWYSSPSVTRNGETTIAVAAGVLLGPQQVVELVEPAHQPEVEVAAVGELARPDDVADDGGDRLARN